MNDATSSFAGPVIGADARRPAVRTVRTVKRLARCLCVLFLCVLGLLSSDDLGAAQVGERAPQFDLTDLQGKAHRLADYAGKVVVINFWASWCPECIEEMPSLNSLYEKFRGKGLVVLGITSDRKRGPVEEALRRMPVSYPVLLETTGKVFVRQYTVIGLPTTVIVNREGTMVERLAGRTDFGSPAFTGKVQALLEGGKGI